METCVCVHTYIYIYLFICIFLHIYKYTYIYIYIYMYMHVCIHVWFRQIRRAAVPHDTYMYNYIYIVSSMYFTSPRRGAPKLDVGWFLLPHRSYSRRTKYSIPAPHVALPLNMGKRP